MNSDPDALLLLCETCAPSATPGAIAALNTLFEQDGISARVRAQSCMNGCAKPSSLALCGARRATYFFRDIDPVSDAPDILATTRAYLSAPDGWIVDARVCGRLRLCLVGRVPSLGQGNSG